MWKTCKSSSWPLFCHSRCEAALRTHILTRIGNCLYSCFSVTITVRLTETCLHVAVISGNLPFPQNSV